MFAKHLMTLFLIEMSNRMGSLVVGIIMLAFAIILTGGQFSSSNRRKQMDALA
jgi:hypothetical protein